MRQLEKEAILVRVRHRPSTSLTCAVALVAVVLAAIGMTGAATAKGPPAHHPPVVSRQAVDFHDAMRKLWEDHITWTRNVIISFEVNEPDATALLPDLNAALDRLLKNQTDIVNAVKPFYGAAAGDQLTALLRDHILIAGKILMDVKTGDAAQYAIDNADWYANAHDIAVFLNGANPTNWPLDEMDAMMKAHLDATTAEVVARHDGDWTGDVAAYDNVHAQILEMADMLSDGIVAQFPSAFRP